MLFETVIAENFSKKRDFKNFLILFNFPNYFIQKQLQIPEFSKLFITLLQRVEDEERFPDEFKPIIKKFVLVFTIEFLKLIEENPGVYNDEFIDIDKYGPKKDILISLATDWVDLVYEHLAIRKIQFFIDEKYFSFLPKPIGKNLNRALYMVIFDFWDPENWNDPLTVNFVRNLIIDMFKNPISSKFQV